MRHTLAVIACGALALILFAGCKQKQGDRCQMNSDCEEGLVCCVSGSQVVTGGQCFPQDKCGSVDGGAKDIGQKDTQKPAPDKAPGDKSPTPDTKAPDKSPTPDTKPADTKAPASDLPKAGDAAAKQ